MRKRSLSVFLSLLLLLSIFTPAVSAYAASGNGLSVSKSEVSPDGEFDLTIAVPKITALMSSFAIKVSFDKDNFEVTSFSPGEISGSKPFQSTPAEANASGELSMTYQGDLGDNTLDVSSGFSVVASFKAKSNAAVGNYDFSIIDYTAEGLADDGYTPIGCVPSGYKSSVSVKVAEAPKPAAAISLNKTSVALVAGSTETLTATVEPSDTTDEVTWESSDTSVATVADGVVTAVAEGTATITAKAGEKSASCKVTVTCNHNLKDVAEKESTCVEKGWDAYKECTICKKLFSADGKTELSGIPYRDPVGHDWGEWVVTKEATCTEKGEKVRTCKRDPSHKEIKEIPKKTQEPVEPSVVSPGDATDPTGPSDQPDKPVSPSDTPDKPDQPVSPSDTPDQPDKPVSPSDTPDQPDQVSEKRMGGSDRYGTANIISSEGWEKADTVVIASGETYPDALAGAVLAKKLNAPILLTAKNAISDETLRQIDKLGAKNAVILGGPAAVSEAVENRLKGKGLNVSRIYGDNRNATAAKIAYNVADAAEQKANGKAETVFLVSNANFADALSVSPVAAIMQAPILYLNKDGSVPAETRQALAALGAKEANIIGGPAAIGTKAEDELKALGIDAKRSYGADRYATAIKVYDSFKSVFTSKDVAIATGKNFPDALAGAAFAANKGTPIFLAGDSATDALKTRVKEAGAAIIYVFGGEAVIPASIVNGLTK